MTRPIRRLTPRVYEYIYGKVPRLCVDIVVRGSGGILLLERSIPPHAGRWYLPGGRVYQQETLSRAAERICREEVGLEAGAVKMLGVIEYLREPRSPRLTTHSVSVVFLVQPKGGAIRSSPQSRRISFFKSPPENIQPEVKRFLLSRHLLRIQNKP